MDEPLAAMERKGERGARPSPPPRGGEFPPPPPPFRRSRRPSRLSPLLSLSAGAAGPKEADQSQEGQGPEEVSAAPGSPQAAAPAGTAASLLPRGEGAAGRSRGGERRPDPSG